MPNITSQQLREYQQNGGNFNAYDMAMSGGFSPSGANVSPEFYSQMQMRDPGIFASAQKAAPAAAAPAPQPTNQNYSQFAQGFANRPAPVIYDGSAASNTGLDANTQGILNSIYHPAGKSTGGFCAPQVSGEGFAAGGAPDSTEMADWTTRAEARDSTKMSGLFNSPVPGRTDKLNTNVPAGSYVIPADVVSGLGEGNTMAGSGVLDKMFHTNPYGIQGERIRGGVGIPHPPAPFRQPEMRAAGGEAAGGHVPIVAAGGEYLVHPEAVKKLGKGDMGKGHRILDHFVVHARNKIANEMKRLPGPKK